jgi:hypothetical protein
LAALAGYARDLGQRVIVLVRTFRSFSLEIELEGVDPWRRRATEVASDRQLATDT